MRGLTGLPRRLLARWSGASVEHHQIVRGMLWVSIFVFAGKLVGATKEMVVAWRFGVGPEVDAYLFIFNLVQWPVGMWFAALTTVLVPLSTRLTRDGPAEADRFRGELLGATLWLGLLLMVLCWSGLKLLLVTSSTGLSPAASRAAEDMLSRMVWLAPLGLVVGLFSTWMLVGERHANTLLESVPSFFIAVAVLAFASAGGAALVWGTVLGFLCHALLLGSALARNGFVRPRLSWSSSHWPAFRSGFGIMFVGQIFVSLTSVIDQFWLASVGDGALSTLGYANRVIALVIGLAATAIGRAMPPVLARARVQGHARVHRIAGFWVRLIFGVGIVALALGWWLAPQVVRLLFERGAFTSANTLAVSDVLRCLLLQVPFYFASVALFYSLANADHYVRLAGIAVVLFAVKVLGNALLAPTFGVNGIALSTSAMYVVSAALYFVLFQRLAAAPLPRQTLAREAGP